MGDVVRSFVNVVLFPAVVITDKLLVHYLSQLVEHHGHIAHISPVLFNSDSSYYILQKITCGAQATLHSD
jgi:hypothetical protein